MLSFFLFNMFLLGAVVQKAEAREPFLYPSEDPLHLELAKQQRTIQACGKTYILVKKWHEQAPSEMNYPVYVAEEQDSGERRLIEIVNKAQWHRSDRKLRLRIWTELLDATKASETPSNIVDLICYESKRYSDIKVIVTEYCAQALNDLSCFRRTHTISS